MPVLHLDLEPQQGSRLELHAFWDNPADYRSRLVDTEEIRQVIAAIRQPYYDAQRDLRPEDYRPLGIALYDWVNGEERWLDGAIAQHSGERLILAIAVELAHLPWELLHDGTQFLLERRIVPVRWKVQKSAGRQPLAIADQPQNRALNLLFMAAAPEGGGSELSFEDEESRIWKATAAERDKNLALQVEESGCLEELAKLLQQFDRGHFDIFHLTGHATAAGEAPYFATETETGGLHQASADDIARALQARDGVRLVFLSGCETGKSGQGGAVPSLAEALLDQGQQAVLGWGQSVGDDEATAMAAKLYEKLSQGSTVTEALEATYRWAIAENRNRAAQAQRPIAWHLLRLYATRSLPGPLVTPPGRPGRQRPRFRPAARQFLDAGKRVPVAGLTEFVGRRRPLQRCLRVLKTGQASPPTAGQQEPKLGVLIHGLGGLGKSSLAARLCDRLPRFQRAVWVGAFSPENLAKQLAEGLRSREQREGLLNADEELRFRLRTLFEQLEDEAATPFLLVLDDFEENLVPDGPCWRLKARPQAALEALLWALRETGAPHRLIITCRYAFESSLLRWFALQPLDGFREGTLWKHRQRLRALKPRPQEDAAAAEVRTWQEQALRLADGNPRLLVWLNEVLDQATERAALLARLAANPQDLREQVLAPAVIDQIDGPLRELLGRGLVFELPVPRAAFAAVCARGAAAEDGIDRATALGLLEVSPDGSLRVPRLLPVQLPANTEALAGQAAAALYRCWWQEAESATEAQGVEIHRLALAGQQGEIAANMANTLAGVWNRAGRYREAWIVCHHTLSMIKDYRVLGSLAVAERFLGDVDTAHIHYEEALRLCPLTDRAYKSVILNNFSEFLIYRGDFSSALKLIHEALRICEEIHDLHGIALAWHGIGRIYYQREDKTQAFRSFRKAINIAKELPDKALISAILSCLAEIYEENNDIENAKNLLMYSLDLDIETGNLYGKANNLFRIACLDEGSPEVLKKLYDVLKIQERIGDLHGQAMTLFWLGSLELTINDDMELSLEYLQKAFEKFKAVKCFNEAKDVEIWIETIKCCTDSSDIDMSIGEADLNDALKDLDSYTRNRICELFGLA